VNDSDVPLATLGDRLRQVRVERFGPDGVDALAQRIGVAPQTWRNYEAIGGLIPAAHLQRFVELTGADPVWLINGRGPKYRRTAAPHGDGPRETPDTA
jgi:hypothetical protein